MDFLLDLRLPPMVFGSIKMGIAQGLGRAFKGLFCDGGYAVGQTATEIADLAMYGHPLAIVALSVALVSEAAPILGAAAISPIVYYIAPYSWAIGDFTQSFFVPGSPSPSRAGYAGITIRLIIDQHLNAIKP